MDAQKAEKLRALQSLMDSVAAGAEPKLDTGKPAHAEPANGEDGERADAWKRLVMLCSHNEFCSQKMTERLLREEYVPADVDEAVAKAVRVGLIDDLRWGEMRVAALMRKGEGMPGIERDLRLQGIEARDLAGWPGEYAERFGSELERARKVLAARPPRSKNPRASAYARLMRKGYSSDIAAQASSEIA